MSNIWFIILLIFGFLFILLFVISTLAIQGKIANSEKIMSIFNLKIFDDPVIIKPETALAIMTLIAIVYLVIEFMN